MVPVVVGNKNVSDQNRGYFQLSYVSQQNLRLPPGVKKDSSTLIFDQGRKSPRGLDVWPDRNIIVKKFNSYVFIGSF